MDIYDQIRAMIEALVGGSAGAFGSINTVKGGTEFKFKYHPIPGSPKVRVISVVPYLIGSSDPSSTSKPLVELQRLLAWQYKPDPSAPQADPAWRCFKIKQIAQILPGAFQRPPDNDLPTLDEEGQNCVRSW
jgi:hypothetical protein